MKKYLITLIVAASATIHAAELENQLPGYWKPDMDKTLALAKKAKRDMDPIMQGMMSKTVFEFQKDKLIIHGPPGSRSDSPPVPFTLKEVDKDENTLTLSANGKEMKARFHEGQMALNDPENGWTIFNPMSKEDFAKRKAGGAGIKAESGSKAPAPGNFEDVSASHDKPATGKVHGREFKVEEATLNLRMNTLELRQGGELKLLIFLFADIDGKFDGKKYTVKSKRESGTPHIHMSRKVEVKGMPQTEMFTEKYTMKLEFGTANNGKIPGKIQLRLPDEAESFVVGTFEAETK